ncbi:hypothetical protein [Mesorhizobium carmichaelinearum]|uniref:hypothetical protein n=1 Tax=Mesorhizobium carmichaelinearum TaxID=1208188 RepID=UPI000BA33D24|nr:hypothetical protein [Mesorhizobium carmichaelinearum]
MLRLFRWKKKLHRDIAVEQFIAHCEREGARLEAWLSSALGSYCDRTAKRLTLSEIQSRPLVSFQGGRLQSNPRTLFAAHCFAIVLSKGLKAMYDAVSLHGQARVIDGMVARLIAEQEVGADHVGHAPIPRPRTGGHILWRPDTLAGGVDSQQLTLVQRYRGLYGRLRSPEDPLSMLCLAFRIVPVGSGVAIRVLEEEPGSRQGDVVYFKTVGYREPEADEVDEWSNLLEILDADQVLEPLPMVVRTAMLAAMDEVDPFWPTFSKTHTLTW